jgi:two-component system cell cycle sensor histidine kinase/response regulator CckA
MSGVSGKTILVVDDDKDIREYIAEQISGMGQTVYTASCGSEAMKLIEDQIGNLDLLLSDVVMPGMSGIELAESLADKEPGVKVILMSGFLQPSPDFGNAARYEKGFIRKPFSGKTLTNHVKKALDELGDN